MGQGRGGGARPEDLPPGLTASGPQRSRSAVSEEATPLPHPPLGHPRAPPGCAFPAAHAAAVRVLGWRSCPVLLSAPACTAARLRPAPREPRLTHGSSVQQGPLSRPEVRAPRAGGVALKPACDLGQVLEAQPLAWEMGAQEKAPGCPASVWHSARPGVWKGAPPFTCSDWARVWGLRGPAPAPPETLLLADSSPGHLSPRPCCQRSVYPTVCPRDQPSDPDTGYEGQLWPGPKCLSPAPRGVSHWPAQVAWARGRAAGFPGCVHPCWAPRQRGTRAQGHGGYTKQSRSTEGSPQLRGRQASAERRGAPALPGSAHGEVVPQWAGSGRAHRGGRTQPCLPWERLPESQSSLTHAGQGGVLQEPLTSTIDPRECIAQIILR